MLLFASDTFIGSVALTNSGGSDNILFVGDVTFENANGDTVTNHTFNITALTDTSYQFEVIGIKSDGTHEDLYSEQLQGDQAVIRQIIKANYTSFELHISGAGVVEETIEISSADFPVERDLDVVDDIDLSAEWITEFERATDPIKVSLADTVIRN